MNAILELFSAYGISPEMATIGSGVVVIGVLAFVVRKKLSKKKKVSGVYEHGDSTTIGYNTKAGNYIDELNMDSVLTQDVQGFSIPEFDKSELEKSTDAQKYRKKIINAATPGLTLGDTRPIHINEEDFAVDSAINIPKSLSIASSVLPGMNPENSEIINPQDNNETAILKDLQQVQVINNPVSLGVSKFGVGYSVEDFDLDLDENEKRDTHLTDIPQTIETVIDVYELPKINVNQPQEIEMNFFNIDSIDNFDFKSQEEKEGGLRLVEDSVQSGTIEKNRILKQSYKPPVEQEKEDVPELNSLVIGELRLLEDNEQVPSLQQEENHLYDKLNIVSDNTDIVSQDEILDKSLDDLSDIPGLNLDIVEESVINQEESLLIPTVKSLLDESLYPETVNYHQEIEKALFLDAEEMKEQSLQILNNTVELVSNVKVRFYFKLAIQSYANSSKENALPEIIKNFYDFEYKKHSK